MRVYVCLPFTVEALLIRGNIRAHLSKLRFSSTTPLCSLTPPGCPFGRQRNSTNLLKLPQFKWKKPYKRTFSNAEKVCVCVRTRT